MIISINLTKAEVAGLKKYLKEVGDVEKPGREEITAEIQNIVSGNLNAPQTSVAYYIGGALRDQNIAVKNELNSSKESI